MTHYCGIDLHSNNHVIVVTDNEDKRVLDKRVDNDLRLTLALLEPYRNSLKSIAVESTFNWYWLVDGLMEQGYDVQLVNTAAIKQYDGLKYSGDHQDAFHLAHLMRLGILPTGYIYPKEQRAVRDLLRRRLLLVQAAAQHIRHPEFIADMVDGYNRLAVDAGLAVLKSLQQQIRVLEQAALSEVSVTESYKILQTITGIGKVLGLTIMLETGDIARFKRAADYASYCRTVDSTRTSNGKIKGQGNAKAGNKYLSWGFSEAAHFCVRFDPLAQRFYQRKKAKTNGIIAIRAVARKLARASWMMLKHQTPYEAKRMFPG